MDKKHDGTKMAKSYFFGTCECECFSALEVDASPEKNFHVALNLHATSLYLLTHNHKNVLYP